MRFSPLFIIIFILLSGCSIETRSLKQKKSADIAFIEPLRDCKGYSSDISVDGEIYKMVSLLDCNGNFVSSVKSQKKSNMCPYFAEASILESMAAVKKSVTGELVVDANPLKYNFAETILYLSGQDVRGTTDESFFPYDLWGGVSYEIENGIAEREHLIDSLGSIADHFSEYKKCRLLKNIDFAKCDDNLKSVSENYYSSIKECLSEVSEQKKLKAVFYSAKSLEDGGEKVNILPNCIKNGEKVLCPKDRIPLEDEIDWFGVEESLVAVLGKGFPVKLEIDWSGMVKDNRILELVKNDKVYDGFAFKRAFPPPLEHALIKNETRACWDMNKDGKCTIERGDDCNRGRNEFCYNEDKNNDGKCSIEGDCLWDKREVLDNREVLYYNFSKIGHVMVIVGYIEREDEERNVIRRFIVKNSWGEKDLFYLIDSPYSNKDMRRVINFNNYFRNREVPIKNKSPLSFISDVHFGILSIKEGAFYFNK